MIMGINCSYMHCMIYVGIETSGQAITTNHCEMKSSEQCSQLGLKNSATGRFCYFPSVLCTVHTQRGKEEVSNYVS